MADEQANRDRSQGSATDKEAERIARESGLPKEQVEQIARGTDPGTDLDEVAGAAARWS